MILDSNQKGKMIKRDENGTIIEVVMDENGDISEEEAQQVAHEVFRQFCEDPKNASVQELAQAVARIKYLFREEKEEGDFSMVHGADGSSFVIQGGDAGRVN